MEEPLPAKTDAPPPPLLRRSANERLAALAADAGVRADAAAKPEQRMASLAVALRRARVENAEHSSALADLRAAEMVRLELLEDALGPVLTQVPKDVDIFDLAILPGERPRLFLDQIGFVEMDRDRRTYRFLQDTRHGRIVLRETADIDDMVEAATNYIAHRLIEREKALAIDYASGGAARTTRARPVVIGGATPREKAFRAVIFLVELAGAAAFFGLVAVIALWAYRTYIAP
jgi:hypothetical protein